MNVRSIPPPTAGLPLGEPQLRAMRWWDIDAAVALERELFGATAWSAQTFWSELARPENRRYSVAEIDGQLVGYAGLMLGLDGQADVQTVAVAASARGLGLGRRLLTRLIDQALTAGATSMILEVRADNEPAIALYTAAGFERIAVRRGYYQPGGQDAWIMRRRPLRGSGAVTESATNDVSGGGRDE